MEKAPIPEDALHSIEPVEGIETDFAGDHPEPGIGLCLSGGGYRAMLFHLGTLWRLNELGYLPKLTRISSVSGGSITSGVLALNWSGLDFDAAGVARKFTELVADPLRRLGSDSVDELAVISGILTPGVTIGDKVIKAYRKHLFGDATLQELPDTPLFIFNATNVQSGALWRFSKPFMRDYRVGEIRNPTTDLAVAVAASSAFPPVLSPVELALDNASFTPDSGLDLQREPFTTDVVLTDGGVYDNLGLETVWKNFETVLVSDGGGKMQAEAEPKKDWIRHTIRVLNLIDNQVRSLRKRQVIDSFRLGTRQGAYWGIRTNIADYQLSTAMDCSFEKTIQLANLATRLKRIEPEIQEKVINWGYAVCDAAMRRHVDGSLPQPGGFPYPEIGVG